LRRAIFRLREIFVRTVTLLARPNEFAEIRCWIFKTKGLTLLKHRTRQM